jgi:SAM-dependent methyltransferase
LEDFYSHFYQRMYGRVPDIAAYIERQHAYGVKVLSITQEYLPKPGWVFEVGCGAGGALQVFAKAGHHVAGCDYSQELINEARSGGLEQTYKGTLDDLGRHLPGIRLDLIYLHHVFEHLNDPLGFLAICRRYLAVTGSLIAIVPDVSRIHRFSNPNGDLMRFLHIAHKHNFSREGLNRLCARAGYTVEELAPDPAIRTVNSEMPELWIAMRLAGANTEHSRDYNAGDRMLRYLVATEASYARHHHRRRLVRGIGRFSPWKIMAKFRAAL